MMGGCPHPQTASRLVYVPSPPAATTLPGTETTTETMVIQEPAPPPTENSPGVQPVEETPAPEVRPPRRRTTTTSVSPEPTPEAAPVPPLQPRENAPQPDAMRREIQGLQTRISQIDPTRLSDANRKTLEDARAFLAQSGQALQEGDLQRSKLLAEKASLLLSALSQPH